MLLDDGTAYTGSLTSDSSGRNLLLNFDATSRNRLIRNLAGWAGYLCELPVSVKSVSPTVIKVRINTAFTSFSGSLTFSAIGSTSNGSGRATYNAVVSGGRFKRR